MKMYLETAHSGRHLSAPGNEVNIINRREIEPLLAKARQLLEFYSQAMACSVSIQDRTGSDINANKQLCFCELCEKPCKKVHADARAESRRREGVYIYTCEVGFVYWTCPLYQNGRYAGALTAGQVLPFGRKAVTDKFRALCKNKTAANKFEKMLEKVPEKSHEEIQAMARLLGVCAGKIPEKGENSGEIIRRIALSEGKTKEPKEQVMPSMQKSRYSSQVKSDSDNAPEKERLLLAAFRRGDNETGGRILKELMNYILAAIPEPAAETRQGRGAKGEPPVEVPHPDNLEIARFRAIELAVLLSRAATTEATGSDTLMETNNRYLGRILESKTVEELIENLHRIAERMSSKIFSFQGIRHASVLRRAERYIWANYTRKISLDEIAKASGLSAPYFSTVFKEEMGENFSSYLNRLRVEKTAVLLLETGKPLNEIAKLCGFEDQSWFSKIFKSFTGISPGKFRENGGGTRRQAEDWNKQDMLSPKV
jgi:AraC-like DNA-binding protein/ligand-binding sensor protein